MTISEAKKFYEQDEELYEIKKNKEFLKWLNNEIKNGYHSIAELETLQKLIDSIVAWYEIKYPEKEFQTDWSYPDFKDIDSISSVMTTRQLLYRLTSAEYNVIDLGYRASGWGVSPIYENGKKVGEKSTIFMPIKIIKEEEPKNKWKSDDYFFVNAEHKTGRVIRNYQFDKYYSEEEDICLEELLSYFDNNYSDKLDYTELKECIKEYNIDIELRNKVLQLVALKLLYSEKTNPKNGYERANKFIEEFNNDLGLSLSTKEIDEIMNRDYTIEVSNDFEEKKDNKKSIKRILKNNKKQSSN